MAEVFVFGSNMAGRHGKGAAWHARREYGAIYGKAEGRQGNSYAIPTKSFFLQPLPLPLIKRAVDRFLDYAEQNWTDTFIVTAIGCGLAGYAPLQIAPMFAKAPRHVKLPPEFEPWREAALQNSIEDAEKANRSTFSSARVGAARR